MFGLTKFQLSISCTFKVMKVFVVYLVIYTTYESTKDRELKFCMSKHLEIMCPETKFQPFQLRNGKQ